MDAQGNARWVCRIICLCLTLCTAAEGFAKVWPECSPDLLTLAAPPEWCSTADAVILYKSCDYTVVGSGRKPLEASHFRRVKIFSEQGRRNGDIILMEALGEEIDHIEGRTINADGTVIKLKSSGILKRTVNPDAPRDYRIHSYTLIYPEVRAGSVLDLSYETTTANFVLLPPYYLDDLSLPTDTSIITFTIPPFVSYLASARNISGHVFVDTVKHMEHGGERRTRFELGTYHLELDTTKSLSPPASYVRSSVSLAITAVRAWGHTFDLNFGWEGLGKIYGAWLDTYGTDEKTVKPLYQRLSRGLSDSTKLAEELYRWVRDSVACDSGYSVYPASKNLGDLLARRRGGASDKVLLLKALLKQAGFRALPVLVAPINGQPVQKSFPAAAAFAHVLLAWDHGPSFVYLDPSHARTPFGVIPWNCEGAGAIFADSSCAGLMLLPVGKDTNQVQCRFDCVINEQGDLHAEGTVTLTNQAWLDNGVALLEADAEGRKKILSQYVLTEVRTENLHVTAVQADSGSPSGVVTLAFDKSGYAQRVGDQLVFHPNCLDRVSAGYLPPDEHRTSALFFSYPVAKSVHCNYTWPAGYQLSDAAGKPVEHNATGLDYQASLHVPPDGNGLAYERQYLRKHQHCEAADYGEVRQFFQAVAADDAVSVALKPKAAR